MESPFTTKRYFVTSLVLGTIAFFAGVFLGDGSTPIWILALLACFVGIAAPFGIWLTGEVAWRGYRAGRLTPTNLSLVLIKFAFGIGILSLAPRLPTPIWDDRDTIANIISLAAWVLTSYAVGQLLAIGKNRRDRTPS
jgi:hypothetical protein